MKYEPLEIESKWVKKWRSRPLHQPADGDQQRSKYYALVEFPYPSGSGLHLGHAFTNTLLDVFSRQKRMAGKNVLYPMGWDAFGLPTENYAIKTGIHPATVTKENTARFKQQNERLGMSFAWEREIDTTDPDYYKWTQWIFLQFFKHGLAYKAATPVGWCPQCKIILANEEIVAGKCERCGAPAEQRCQPQWLLRITAYADRLADELDLVDYPAYVKKAQRDWIGRTEGLVIDYPLLPVDESVIEAGQISCYTTRPDTNFGATFIVLSPEYPGLLNLATPECRENVSKYIKIYQKASRLKPADWQDSPIIKTGVFTGRYALNRLTSQPMPVWVADFVVAAAGTGAVVGVPAHDARDFAFAKKYHLEIKPVVRPKNGDDWDYHLKPLTAIDVAEIFNSGFLDGLSPVEAKQKIIAYLIQKGWGKIAVNYHLRDWIFSRQHYWGEPIPMIYCESCAQRGLTWWGTMEGQAFLNSKHEAPNSKQTSNPNDQNSKRFENLNLKDLNLFRISNFEFRISKGLAGWFPVSEEQLPVKLPQVERYQPTDTGESPLANITSFTQVACPECGRGARRETDTMPNWAGSSWYYLAYTFADELRNTQHATRNTQHVTRNTQLGNVFQENRARLDYWLPVDLYLGGAEHTTLHLLYSRFWHKFLNDLGLVPGKEPYAARRQHGVILGSDGSRMSKSRGNIVNPEEIIEKYGADTLRLYLLFMGPYDTTMPWDPKGVEGIWRFLNRVWKLVSINQLRVAGCELKEKENPVLKIRNSPACRAGRQFAIEQLAHRTIKKVTEDIEHLKFNTAIAALMEYVNGLTANNFEFRISNFEFSKTLVLLLAPFAPFMAEELWTKVLKQPYSVHQQPWPKFEPALAQEEEKVIIVQVNGKLRGQISTRHVRRNTQHEIEQLVQTDPQIAKYLAGRTIKKTIYVPGKLINFVV